MTLILSELRSIRANLEERGSRDAVKDEAFDRLYESLDASQRARTLGDLRGILQDLFLFHDRIDQIRRETDESSLSDLTSLHQELLEILERQGVQVLTESSARFDPGFQTVVGFEPCDQADLDGTVLRVVRNGFRSGDVLMRAQDVVLARYRRESTGSKEPDSSGDSESSFVTKEAKPQ